MSLTVEEQSGLINKLRQIYTTMRSQFYLCRDDLTVGETKLNSALVFGLLTEVNRSNLMIFGEYGGGKTTSAEYLHCICNALPLGLVKRVALRGDPQKVDEKIVGRPHYGKLYGEEEEVVWQHFVLVGPKIVDEFNRIPESNQSIVLNGVDRGEWTYLNDFIYTGPQPLISTCNYADRGNNTVIPTLLDRFDLAVESKFPGVANAYAIASSYRSTKDRVLYNKELTIEALAILNSHKPYFEIKQELANISNMFREQLISHNIPSLTEEDIEKISHSIEEVPVSNLVKIYMSFLMAELNIEPSTGQKRSIDDLVTQNGAFLSSLFIGSGSRRADKSIMRYAKSIAWFLGKEEVGIDEITAVAPYALWHRLTWSNATIETFKDEPRKDPLNLAICKKVLGEGNDKVPGVLKRVRESARNYTDVLGFIKNKQLKDAQLMAALHFNEGKGHPIFYDLMEELE